MAEAQGLIQVADNHVLAGQVCLLTSEETNSTAAFIDATRSAIRQALTGTDNVMPKTVIDSLLWRTWLRNILFSALINFMNTEAPTDILSAQILWRS